MILCFTQNGVMIITKHNFHKYLIYLNYAVVQILLKYLNFFLFKHVYI